MAFANAQIISTLGGVLPAFGYREDLSIGDIVVLSISAIDLPYDVSYSWEILGRPEGSTAGGAGPEPISLGDTATATFVVDSDAGYPKDGSYLVQCELGFNGQVARIQALLVRLSSVTLDDGRKLRVLAPFETSQDTSQAVRSPNWSTMVCRWLRKIDSMAVSAYGPDWEGYHLSNAAPGVYTGPRPDRVYCANVNRMPGTVNVGWATPSYSNYISAVPIIIGKAGSFKGFFIRRNSGVAGGSPAFRVGLYSNLAKGHFPDALIYDSGSIACPLNQVYGVACDVAVLPGLYWLTSSFNADVLAQAVTMDSLCGYSIPTIIGWKSNSDLLNVGSNCKPYVESPSAYGALPATYPIAGAFLANAAAYTPAIYYRWGA
jgi:hypothetical protein